jgi:hypothetical protein
MDKQTLIAVLWRIPIIIVLLAATISLPYLKRASRNNPKANILLHVILISESGCLAWFGLFQLHHWYADGTLFYASRARPWLPGLYISYAQAPAAFSFVAAAYIGCVALFSSYILVIGGRFFRWGLNYLRHNSN